MEQATAPSPTASTQSAPSTSTDWAVMQSAGAQSQKPGLPQCDVGQLWASVSHPRKEGVGLKWDWSSSILTTPLTAPLLFTFP